MGAKITDWQLMSRAGKLLLGLAIPDAVLDIESDRETLIECLRRLESPPDGLPEFRVGKFGPFHVTLNLDDGDSVSIFVDGPRLERAQSSAIWVDKESRCVVLREIAAGHETR